MGNSLEGTIVLGTGASSGIGAGSARRLAREGASVALIARRADRLADVATAIESEGGTARAIVADITAREAAHDAVEEAVAAFGCLDTVPDAPRPPFERQAT
ncbi:SDR family NAD(P)-dependent oxidoreductase [Streptomyces sp. G1]|uniref:SDR family NAD(P)-dependent oxidoreductase n=1 Tax=Streptomyces sp. G1 TaxID=361572 RepID=UPI00203073A8|nr:SDR family NAD(P)-dependent oxidoreductase [Streptomyces sp. G1]MCM1965898.1 SDR family NAD(P)-dependent oxidoreductase [Streptomyces sp. G1]